MQSRNLKQLARVAGITDLLSISCHFHRPASLQGQGFPEKQIKKKNLVYLPSTQRQFFVAVHRGCGAA